MLRIRSTEGELDIAGTSGDFDQLKRAIDRLLTRSEIRGLELPCEPSSEAEILASLFVRCGDSRNTFRVSDNKLEITGSPESLENFRDHLPIGKTHNGTVAFRYDSDSFPEFVAKGPPTVTLTSRT